MTTKAALKYSILPSGTGGRSVRMPDVNDRIRRFLLRLAMIASLMMCAANGVAGALPEYFASPPMDSSFEPGLAAVKKASGLREIQSVSVPAAWTPGLQMIIGFRTDIGAKHFVNLVELTTLAPSDKDAKGRPAVPTKARAEIKMSGKNSLVATQQVSRFVTERYPVRIRVFDAQGRFLKQGQCRLPWGFMTNNLVEIGDLMRQMRNLTNAAASVSNPGATTNSQAAELRDLTLRLNRSISVGYVELMTLFFEVQFSPALKEINAHALDVARSINVLQVVMELGLNLNITPQFEQMTLLPPEKTGDVMCATFPLQIKQGSRTLGVVKFIAGPPGGAGFLTGGIRAIRLTHPTRTDRQMLAQVLATGAVSQPETP